MKLHYYLKNPQHPITVNVIGVGGTGSLVLPRLARLDYALKLLGHPGLMVFAYDADKVEEFNVGRQNFSDCDLGRNKAIVMVEKCNLAFGLLWKARPREFKPSKTNSANITIICVDNAKFRVDYYAWLKESCDKSIPFNIINNPFFTIDGGNGKDFGQVVISSPMDKTPNTLDLFPDFESQDTEEIQGIGGCSYEDSLKKQDLFINDEIALNISKLMWKIFRENELTINSVIVNQQKMKTLPIKLL